MLKMLKKSFLKMSAYRRDFSKPLICFLIKDGELLEKYNEIWEKVKNSTENEFDSEPVYNKIKSYNGKINTIFRNNKIPKEGSKFICLSVIFIDSIFRAGKNYYPQAFVEQCRYAVKQKRCLSIILTTEKFLLLILIEKILMKKFPMKKILMKKNSNKEN